MERQNAIYDAALTVFAEAGLGRATLNDVAERAGVTKGCLYHYFESKEALFIALMRNRTTSTFDKTNGAAAPGAQRDEIVSTLIRQLWQYFQQPGQLELTTLAITELPKAPEIARVLFDEVVRDGRHVMSETLRAVSQETAMTDAEIDVAATIIPYLVMGAALGLRLFQGIDPAAPSAAAAEKAVTSILSKGI
jgi:AcrR family transcriptional regulator